MEAKAFAPGIYPRSQALVEATRDLERGRTTARAVDEQFEGDFEQLVEAQEQAGLDLLTDGLLRWQDIFRPLAERADGLDARPLTRFLDTNTFYRAVLVEGEPRLEHPLPAPSLPPGRWVATLPSPLAFSFAAGRAVSPQALAAGVLAPQIETYAAAGCALVVLSEPFLLREGGIGELEAALAELPDSVPLALQLVFGDAGPMIDDLSDLPVDAIGVDFYSTSLETLPAGFPKTILAGVVDVRSSAVEDVSEVARFVETLGEREPAGLSVVPNGDLQFVPEPIARRKLSVLAEARVPLKEIA
jgi:5-methyltetrahydropteroyltriglutamate--homocysteine methyltransferase